MQEKTGDSNIQKYTLFLTLELFIFFVNQSGFSESKTSIFSRVIVFWVNHQTCLFLVSDNLLPHP